MYIAYAFRALCDAQLIWNSEDIDSSSGFLHAAQARPGFPGSMSDRERSYFAAVQALNGASAPPAGAAIVATRPARYAMFLSNMTSLAAAFPSDFTARSFVPLATLALGSVGDCVLVPWEAHCQSLQRAARADADDARLANPSFPGTLHYGMHAHDFAARSVYLGGLVYAEEYPRLVSSAVHSLHMPSHIFERAGLWRNASVANLQSIAAGAIFAASGALAADGGPISEARGLPFSFNAGNTYHSLEYGQYELLQTCEYNPARALLRQMRYATYQALTVLPAAWGHPIERGATADAYAATLGRAVFNATTYHGWAERMGARQAIWAAFATLFGGVLADSEHARHSETYWRGLLTSAIPLPTSWVGSDVYDHSFYAPPAEAGALAARAFAELTQLLLDGLPLASPPPSLGAMCMHDDECAAAMRVDLALDVIQRAASHYDHSVQPHEAACVRALGLQIRALAALTRNETALARALVANASALELAATTLVVPSSITLCFLPSSALEGWLLLTRAADAAAAVRAFEACLAPTGTPHAALCALGLARAHAALDQRSEAVVAYSEVITEWGHGGSCGAAVDEATAYVGVGNAAEVRIGYLGSDFYPDGTPCPWGRDMRLAAELAIDAANAAGGFGGWRAAIVVTHQLNGTTATLDAALTAMEVAGVHAVIGADWSRVALAAASRLAALGVPLLPAGATSAALDAARNVFRTSYSMSVAQPRLVQAAAQLGKLGPAADGAPVPRVGLVAS